MIYPSYRGRRGLSCPPARPPYRGRPDEASAVNKRPPGKLIYLIFMISL